MLLLHRKLTMFIVLMLMFNDPCDGDRRKREQLSRFADKNEIESFMIEIDTITERVHKLAQDISYIGRVPIMLQDELNSIRQSLENLDNVMESVIMIDLKSQFSVLEKKKNLRLNLASGQSHVPGFINVDGTGYFESSSIKPDLRIN